MGGHHSLTKYGNTGIINYGSGNIKYSNAKGTGSTVANATAKMLRIFYQKQEIELEDLLVKADSETTKRVFKPKADISFVDLPPQQHLEGPSLEEGFATILVADPEDKEVYIETISLNFSVPCGACCIVTDKNEIKFRKTDGGVWIDEDGYDPK